MIGAFANLEILDEWDLLDDDPRLERYSMNNWRALSDALISQYNCLPAPVLGSVLPGLHQGILITEGAHPPSVLATSLLLHEAVWLPDPIFSFLVPKAARVWRHLPESGKTLSDIPSIRIDWKQLWDFKPQDRRSAVQKHLPKILSALRQLQPLIEAGVVRLFAWEAMLLDVLPEICASASELQRDTLAKSVMTRFKQHEYNLGLRLGPIGVQASPDQPPESPLKPGEDMWFVDTTPIILYGLANAWFSAHLAATLLPELPGDRVVHDFVMSGGITDPTIRMAAPIVLPNLSEAVMADIVPIRENSYALAKIRELLIQATGFSEDFILTQVHERLLEVSKELRDDVSLKKSLRGGCIDFCIGEVVGTAFGVATGMPEKGIAIVALTSAAKAYISRVLKSRLHPDEHTKRVGAELLIRIAERMSSNDSV